MQDFKELRVWQQAMDLVDRCYETTDGFPHHERYGLTSQVRRSAVSVASNIAEGCGRGTPREFARFLQIAYGSACELETQLLISERLGLAGPDDVSPLSQDIDRLRRQLAALIARIGEAV